MLQYIMFVNSLKEYKCGQDLKVGLSLGSNGAAPGILKVFRWGAYATDAGNVFHRKILWKSIDVTVSCIARLTVPG